MANALAQESSPYLRQHQQNPVDWLPWGAAALRRAHSENRPLLLSIGYSACHWCHVMERECFEDPQIAALMNANFVCVKVDREERPDIDAIYMEAVQGMTGHGGWPLTVFLTPEQLPFYGGTYFPPEERGGMPGFPQVLQAVAAAWSERADEIRATGERIREHLAASAQMRPAQSAMTAAALSRAVENLRQIFDHELGGFGAAPKFPPSSALEFLLARAADGPRDARSDERQMALRTLRAMADGGIHDQLGGGFHRYAVDASWRVPHFEKMLYDNALLASAYLHGFQLSGDSGLLAVCISTLDWALREMRGPEGGFYSALDADSEGVEARYYVWTVGQLRDALGEQDGALAAAWFQATEQGNFSDPHHPEPGLNVLQAGGPAPDAQARERIRSRLLALRQQRPRPSLDDKRLTSWNALMISALAQTGAYLKALPATDASDALGAAYIDAAVNCAEFLLTTMRDQSGRLLRTYNRGQARLQAYLEDHAFLLEALIDLYEATFQERWYTAAVAEADVIIRDFADPGHGGFFTTAVDHEALLARRRDLQDSPIPAGSSSAARGLLRLAALSGNHEYEQQALGALGLTHEIACRHPSSFGHTLRAIEMHLAAPVEVAIIGPDRLALERAVRQDLRPYLVLAAGDGGDTSVPLLHGRTPIDGRAAAYVCERFSCSEPVGSPQALRQLLAAGRAADC